MAISACGEGCHKQMEPFLDQVMEGVMNYINDPHPRVRFACCNAIGQMSTDFAPVFEKKFHAKVIPGLLHLMQDSANPRVQAHSGINQSENLFTSFSTNESYLIFLTNQEPRWSTSVKIVPRTFFSPICQTS